MTQQEFVKKESEIIFNEIEDPIANSILVSIGIRKGLEISKRFVEWADSKWYIRNPILNNWEIELPDKSIKKYTTDELLTIFLTEKYGNNG